ncbi:uncharacterized protein LOC104883322 [Beta vulgaris subsp. vulgaris]|uniref:uncharacterized protein LOC104883322 n=1 Tax=Beta vulgaris subsp. vulgaris TaxID=3555 RepID=UPI0025470D3E|nr:uncharacterized protein LOC104883322 [Beta vulgaris subsp. vulgaris]
MKAYVIVLIVLGSVAALGLFLFFIITCRKKKQRKSSITNIEVEVTTGTNKGEKDDVLPLRGASGAITSTAVTVSVGYGGTSKEGGDRDGKAGAPGGGGRAVNDCKGSGGIGDGKNRIRGVGGGNNRNQSGGGGNTPGEIGGGATGIGVGVGLYGGLGSGGVHGGGGGDGGGIGGCASGSDGGGGGGGNSSCDFEVTTSNTTT